MAKTRREFTPEFNREAVALLESSGRPQMQVAAELGIQPSMLRQWRATLNGSSPGPRFAGSMGASPPSPVASPSGQAAEIARLRRELDRTRMERDVLKKRMARPVRKVVGEGACVRSAQTYPACRRSGRRQDGAYPKAIQHRLQTNCEVLWNEVILVAPKRAEPRAFDVVVPLAVVNGGPAVAVVEWIALRVANEVGGPSLLYRPEGLVRDPGVLTGRDVRAALEGATGFGEFAVMPGGVRELAVLLTRNDRSAQPDTFWPLGNLVLSVHVKYRGLPAPVSTKSVVFESKLDHRSALAGTSGVRVDFSRIEL